MKLCLSSAPAGAAESLAETLVGERLAACVNILGPVRSLFWWEGKIQREDEVLLMLKTRDDLVEALMTRLAVLHPYDVPELLVVPIESGLPAYLAWINAETRQEVAG